MAPAHGRFVLSFLLAVSTVALGGCTSPYLGGDMTCSTTTPASITSTGGMRSAVTAGVDYRIQISARGGSMLGATTGIQAVLLPAGASVDSGGVWWTPRPSQVGTTQQFRVRSTPDLCGNTAELAWSSFVFPPILISRFDVTPATVSTSCHAVSVSAEYSGGEGRLLSPFNAPFPSGSTIDVGEVCSPTSFSMTVTGPAGDVVSRDLLVEVQAPPVFTSTAFNPPVVAAGDIVVLSWRLTGTVTNLTLDPGAIQLAPLERVIRVSGVPAGITYTLTARNDAGDVAVATISPVVLPVPVIVSFAADPPHPTYLGTTQVTAVFEGGEGVLGGPGAPSMPITSGVSVTLGPFHGSTALYLGVSNAARYVELRPVITLSGPGTWEPLPGGTASGRWAPSATLLADGRVLIAGGFGGNGMPSLDTSWCWDPVTGASTPGPRLLHPRMRHTAALLADGRVLLAGGELELGYPADEAEVLDLVAWTSEPAGSVGDAWQLPQLVALPDGSAVLHATSMLPALGSPILRFDPTTSSLALLTTAYGLGAVHALAMEDGRVLLLSGGRNGLTPSAILDPASGALIETGATLREAATFEAVALADGRVLVLDGQSPAQFYNPATGTFAWTGAPIITGAVEHAVLLPDGQVLVAGPTSMRFDPVTQTFRETGGMLWNDRRGPLLLLPDGTVLATAGETYLRYTP